MSEEILNAGNLLSEFMTPNYSDWKLEAESSLKGKPVEKLISKTYEDIDIKPIYNADVLKNLIHNDFQYPGIFPFIRGSSFSGYKSNKLQILQSYNHTNPADFNKAAIIAIENGQNAIIIKPYQPSNSDTGNIDENSGTIILTCEDYEKAFESIDFNKVPVYLKIAQNVIPTVLLFYSYLIKKGHNTQKIKGGFYFDPLMSLEISGISLKFEENILKELNALVKWSTKNLPNFDVININASIYQEAGGNAIQELGLAFGKAVYYLRKLSESGFTVDEIAKHMKFSFAVGPNFFLEIAKLRAARLIWAKIVQEFDAGQDAQRMDIHAESCKWNKSLLDPYTNVLRTTSEALSAIIAGCNSLELTCFDESNGSSTEFSQRIARNIQIILKEECNLNEVIDPAGGSYYIESLTDSLAKGAWSLFQDIEKSGAYYNSLLNNLPQNLINQTAAERIKNISIRKDIIVGTNKYPNLDEKIPSLAKNDKLQLFNNETQINSNVNFNKKYNLIKSNFQSDFQNINEIIEAYNLGANFQDVINLMSSDNLDKIEILPIKALKLTVMFEDLRTASENYKIKSGDFPTVFLVNYGSLSHYKARADFATDFFKVGGFKTINPSGFDSIEEATQSFINSNAQIAVICSTDEMYQDIVHKLTPSLKLANPNVMIVLAGFPSDKIGEYKQAGIDEFIHIKANIYEILLKVQKICGVI